MGKIAWVAGATGLVGGHIVSLLNHDPAYGKVIAFVRKPVQTEWSAHARVRVNNNVQTITIRTA